MVRSIFVILGVLSISTCVLAQDVTVTVPQPEPAPAPAAEPVAAPAPAIDTSLDFHGLISQGHSLYIQQNFEGAMQSYEAAKNKEPGDPMVYYFIGCVQIKLARFDDAQVTFTTVKTMAGDKDTNIHAKALFMLAHLEELRSNLDAAMNAWTAYKGYVQTRTVAANYIATADARMAVIEAKRALDEQYKVVVERIQASK